MNTSSLPISQELIEQWEEARNAAGQLEEQILVRVEYVLRVWYAAFGGTLDNWYFYGAEESSVGDLSRNMTEECVSNLCTSATPHPKGNGDHDGSMIIMLEGAEWEWQQEFPTRWLFEDCEHEIIEGKKLFEEQQARKKKSAAEKRSEKKAKDEALAQTAKAKLSKEELQALKRTL